MASIWVIGAALCGYAWLAGGGTGYWLKSVTLLALAVSGCLLVWHWCQIPCGQLTWDGECWVWQAGGKRSPEPLSGAVERHLDLQSLLLLRFRSEKGQKLWLWLDSRMAPGNWLALRRALAARRKAAEAIAGPDGAVST